MHACPQTHVSWCQAGMKGDELCWLSLSLMWPVSFPLSGHSHRLVRAKVMSDSFSRTSSRIDWACPAQSKHVNLLVVTASIEDICGMAGKREWMTNWGKDGEGGRQANTFNKQTNEWVSWTVMRCFIDAIGKLLFCLLVSTGRSDLLYSSLPGSGQVSVFLLVDTSAGSEVYRLKGSFSNQATHLSLSMTDWESKVLNCLITNVGLCSLPAVRGLADRPRGCRVWQRAGLTTCCLTVVWCTLGSCLLQVTTQDSPRTFSSTHVYWRNNITQEHRHTKLPLLGKCFSDTI